MHDVKKRVRPWSVKAGVCAAILLSGSAVATAGDVVEMKEASAILDECVAAETSLLTTRSAAGSIDEAYRTALYSSSAHVVNAYRLSLLAPWSADASSLRSKLATSLVTTIGKLAGFDRPPASWSAADLRSALTKEAVRVHRATVLLQGIAPPPPPVPVPSTAPVATPGSATDFTWTDLNPSADSKVYYVSSSTGSDSNDGLAPDRPLKTLRYARSQLRNGYPDWMLLKRGDSWIGKQENFNLGVSGRSPSEPIVIWSYGASTERPRIVDGYFYSYGTLNNVSIVGLSFERVDSSTSENNIGLFIASPGGNVVLEDLRVKGYDTNIMIDGPSVEQPIQGVKIRGCVITDSRGGSGVLVGKVAGLVIEGCVLDHNGWSEEVPGFPSNMFNHNMYLYHAGYPVVVRNCILARASSHGFTIPSGLAEDNLFLQNPIGMSSGKFTTVRRNVFLDGRDIDDAARGYGVWLGGLDGGEIADNVLAHQTTGTGGNAIMIDVGSKDYSVHDNLVYQWQTRGAYTNYSNALMFVGPVAGVNRIQNNYFELSNGYLVRFTKVPSASALQFSGNNYYSGADIGRWFLVDSTEMTLNTWSVAVGESDANAGRRTFTDPNRSAATYNASLGGTATLEAFIAEARMQSRSAWRPAYAARAVNAYIRTGFDMTVK